MIVLHTTYNKPVLESTSHILSRLFLFCMKKADYASILTSTNCFKYSTSKTMILLYNVRITCSSLKPRKIRFTLYTWIYHKNLQYHRLWSLNQSKFHHALFIQILKPNSVEKHTQHHSCHSSSLILVLKLFPIISYDNTYSRIPPIQNVHLIID